MLFGGRREGRRPSASSAERPWEAHATRPGRSEATVVQLTIAYSRVHVQRQEEGISVVTVTFNNAADPCWASFCGAVMNTTETHDCATADEPIPMAVSSKVRGMKSGP